MDLPYKETMCPLDLQYKETMCPLDLPYKETMCPLAPPQNQHFFIIHLNYLDLKAVWTLNIELSEH